MVESGGGPVASGIVIDWYVDVSVGSEIGVESGYGRIVSDATLGPGERGFVSRLSRSSVRHRICIAGPTVTWAPVAVSVRETPQTPPRKSVTSDVQT